MGGKGLWRCRGGRRRRERLGRWGVRGRRLRRLGLLKGGVWLVWLLGCLFLLGEGERGGFNRAWGMYVWMYVELAPCINVPNISCSSIGSSINSSSLSDSEELLYPAAKGSFKCAGEVNAEANIPSCSLVFLDVAGCRRVGRSESLRMVGFEFSIVLFFKELPVAFSG